MNSPHVAVGAVVRRGPDILLVSEEAEDAEPVWALPGGAVLPKESMLTALHRTVTADTGLSDVLVGALIWVVRYTVGGEDFTSYGFEVLGGVGGDERALAPAAEWVRADAAIERLAKMWFAPIREPAVAYITGRAVPATLWTWVGAPDGEPEVLPGLFREGDRTSPPATPGPE